MGSWTERFTDDDGRLGVIEMRGGLCTRWRKVVGGYRSDVSPLVNRLLFVDKEDDKRNIDVLLMGNRVGRPSRQARLVAAGEVIAEERRSSAAFPLEEAGAT
jgi:hypothetical protein